jgi:heparanase 1
VRAHFPVGFAAFAMDFHPAAEGPTWGLNASILEVDLTNPALVSYAHSLAPGILRLGGSQAGSMLMYTDFPQDNVTCPAHFYYCLSRARWDEIVSFARTTGVRLMLDLNLIGPNQQSGNWEAQLSNIKSLFAYTASSKSHVAAWEVGNENQHQLKPAEAARRVQQIRNLLNEAWPDPQDRPLLVGPSVHIYTDWIIDFLGHLRDNDLSVMSYHLYAGCGRAPRIKEQMPTSQFLDDSQELVRSATWATRSVKPNLPLMVTETAPAWFSGVSGGTNAFMSSFWYLDNLAFAALNGYVALTRQTLIGGNYSLIDQNHNFFANPDYFVAKLWRQVVEGDAQQGRALQCSRKAVLGGDIHHELRSYAFCRADNTLVLAILNTGDASLSARVVFGDAVAPGQEKREEYVLQSAGSDLESRSVTLNGQLIEAFNGSIPALLPRVVTGGGLFLAPARSVSFVVFPSLVPRGCRQQPAGVPLVSPTLMLL